MCSAKTTSIPAELLLYIKVCHAAWKNSTEHPLHGVVYHYHYKYTLGFTPILNFTILNGFSKDSIIR